MIDAHVHLWRIGRNDCRWPGADLAPIHRDFTVPDLESELEEHGVDSAILIQSQESEVDTRWLLETAEQDRRIGGVVGWVELTAPDAPARIDGLMAAGPLVGIRPMVQTRADDWYDDPALEPGLAHLARQRLVLEALVQPRHLPALLRLARRWPTLTIVIDHGAKPAVGGDLTDWTAAMAALAQCPHVLCKLSGLLTERVPGADDVAVRDCIDRLFHAFGPDRLIWGSDWPVVMLAAPYGDWLALARQAIPAAHHAAIFATNAARAYRLWGTA